MNCVVNSVESKFFSYFCKSCFAGGYSLYALARFCSRSAASMEAKYFSISDDCPYTVVFAINSEIINVNICLIKMLYI